MARVITICGNEDQKELKVKTEKDFHESTEVLLRLGIAKAR